MTAHFLFIEPAFPTLPSSVSTLLSLCFHTSFPQITVRERTDALLSSAKAHQSVAYPRLWFGIPTKVAQHPHIGDTAEPQPWVSNRYRHPAEETQGDEETNRLADNLIREENIEVDTDAVLRILPPRVALHPEAWQQQAGVGGCRDCCGARRESSGIRS